MRGTKARRYRNIGCIPATSDQDAADTRVVVPRIESVPASAKERLKPSTEIHWRRIAGYADVAKIPRTVSRRYVYASTKCNCEMRKISADTYLFLVTLGGRTISSCMHVSELDPVMHIVANGLHSLPSSRLASEEGPGKRGELLCIAVPGSGWVEFDPTNGIVGNRDLIRVGVARTPQQAIPLFGSYWGDATDDLGMDVSVQVTSEGFD